MREKMEHFASLHELHKNIKSTSIFVDIVALHKCSAVTTTDINEYFIYSITDLAVGFNEGFTDHFHRHYFFGLDIFHQKYATE